MLQTLYAYLDDRSDRVIHWQREMTSRPALGPENGGQGETAKAEWLAEELKRLAVPNIVSHPCEDARVSVGYRPNISARIPGKSPRTLWVIGHMDVVPPGDESLWGGPPYELRVEGDYIFGRGVEDNQQAIASALLVAECLRAKEVEPETGFGMLFVSDEETGMKYGLPHVLQSAPDLFGPDDMFLVPDMGVNDGSMIEIAEKSCLWLRITVTGKQCHASTPDQGVNSLVAASACVLELEKLYTIFRSKNPLFSPSWSTFVPSKKEANVENINTLPGRDVFYLDCRVLPEYDLAEVEKEVRLITKAVAAKYSVDVTVEAVHQEQAPDATPQDSAVVQKLTAALTAQRGITPTICGAGGQTVAACLRGNGLPAAVWATLLPNPHTPNERSRISATIADAKVMLEMLFDAR